jgi:hypothetical protein
MQKQFTIGRAAGLIALCASLTGCASLKPRDVVLGSGYHPENIYLSTPTLSPDLKRVAVLPLMADPGYSTLLEGRDALESVLTAELIKTKKFEIVRATPEVLASSTGRSGWTGEEALPAGMLDSLRRVYNCDAVLFCQLTVFRAYAPMSIGWRMKLVDAKTAQILWAGDEVFDSGQRSVQAGSRRYQLRQQRSVDNSTEEWVRENSPRHFGQYTVARLFATMPAR